MPRLGDVELTRIALGCMPLSVGPGRERGLAGHNGLKSLARELGGPDFHRVRVGVGRPTTTDPEVVSAYVLGRFEEPEPDVRALVERAADALEELIGAPAGRPA